MENPEPEMKEISVIHCDQTYGVMLPVTATILNLKQKMETILVLPVERQQVFTGTMASIRLENENVLRDVLTPRRGDTVFLREGIEVWVKIRETGKRVLLAVFTDNYACVLKQLLKLHHGVYNAESRPLTLANPSTKELVLIPDQVPFYMVVNPVSVTDGTEFLLLD